MNPNTAIFVQALRAGKSENECLRDYCWARSVVPIWNDGRSDFNPATAPVCWPSGMALAKAADEADEGADDASIAAAFEEGLSLDGERGLLFRAMEKHERPTAVDLIRAMNANERSELSRFANFGSVGHDLASAEAEAMFPDMRKTQPTAFSNLTRLIARVRTNPPAHHSTPSLLPRSRSNRPKPT